MLKHCDHAGGGWGDILLHGIAFFADDVADAITSVPEQFQTIADVDEGEHVGDDGTRSVVTDVGALVHHASENTDAFNAFRGDRHRGRKLTRQTQTKAQINEAGSERQGDAVVFVKEISNQNKSVAGDIGWGGGMAAHERHENLRCDIITVQLDPCKQVRACLYVIMKRCIGVGRCRRGALGLSERRPICGSVRKSAGKKRGGTGETSWDDATPLKAATDASVFAAETAAVKESQAEADAAAMCEMPQRVMGTCCLKKD